MLYLYRADGTKLRKTFNFLKQDGSVYTTITDYLDGFQYLSTVGSEPNEMDPVKFAYEQEAFIDNATTDHPVPVLSFFPTAEGFYDYEKKMYIYQYKDHLGNVRVSYKKGTNGLAEITDQNDYYPFGMNILREEKAIFGVNSLYNYKYNGKELQESGQYDYGARFYMADIGRWGVVDPLAEIYYSHSPFNYVGNNPIIRIDPFGMDWYTDKDGNYKYDANLNKDNAEKFFKDNKIEGGKYFGVSGNVEVFSKDSDGNKIKTLSNHKLNEDGSVLNLLSGEKLDGGTGFETEMGFSINAYDDKPDAYYFAGGEQWQSNDGNTYQIQFGDWVKLSGVTVNYDAYNSISSLGYVPSHNATYGDHAIMRNGAKKTLNDAIGLEGLISGTVIEALASKKISAPNPVTLLLGAVYNMYSGMIDQVSTDIQRDKSIKDARK